MSWNGKIDVHLSRFFNQTKLDLFDISNTKFSQNTNLGLHQQKQIYSVQMKTITRNRDQISTPSSSSKWKIRYHQQQ